jgi:hypothetical protein
MNIEAGVLKAHPVAEGNEEKAARYSPLIARMPAACFVVVC